MQSSLKALLKELEAFGRPHDSASAEPGSRMLNITPDTGEFLTVLIRATGATRILELGTSNGYSTLWLAEAAGSGGRVLAAKDRTGAHQLRPFGPAGAHPPDRRRSRRLPGRLRRRQRRPAVPRFRAARLS